MTDMYTVQDFSGDSLNYDDEIIPVEISKLMEMLGKLENLTPPMSNELVSSIVAI